MACTERLLEQLTWHWDTQVRPRLEGLTDDEYFWEPAPGSWSLRPRGAGTAPIQAGSGAYTLDFAHPEPEPAPVTSIAWRLGHLLVGVFGARVASHFGGPACDYQSYDYPATAADALARLDEVYTRWVDGVRGLDETALGRPVGEAEGPWADHPMETLVLHIHREAIHHLAEIALLRDLWANGVR
ncbi:MAG TPA: DinB family protein [Propionibacterium sp.]|nr:DinB family protein [Propionibacterium sp.]